MNIVGSLDKSDAMLFSQLCAFVIQIGNPVAVVYDFNHKIYVDAGINFGSLSHLESTGLLHFQTFTTYTRTNLGLKVLSTTSIAHSGLNFHSNRRVAIGWMSRHVLLTRAGMELGALSWRTTRRRFCGFCEGALEELWTKDRNRRR